MLGQKLTPYFDTPNSHLKSVSFSTSRWNYLFVLTNGYQGECFDLKTCLKWAIILCSDASRTEMTNLTNEKSIKYAEQRKSNLLAIHFSSGVSHDPDYRKHLFAFVYVFCDRWNKGLQIFFRKNSPQDGFESGVLFMNFHLFLWQVVGSPVRQSHLLFSWLQRAGIRHRSPRLPIWQRRDQKLLTRTIGGIVRCSLEQYFRQIITRLIPNLLAGPLSSVIFLSMLLYLMVATDVPLAAERWWAAEDKHDKPEANLRYVFMHVLCSVEH